MSREIKRYPAEMGIFRANIQPWRIATWAGSVQASWWWVPL